MIQDIAPHRLDNRFQPGRKPEKDSPVVCLKEEKVLLPGGDFPRRRDFPGRPDEAFTFLFMLDRDAFFFTEEDAPLPEEEGTRWVSIRDLRRERLLPREMIFALYTARQLIAWYRNNRFCGRCGARTFHDEKERAIRCACGHLIYPRIVPAVIVGVLHEGKMLVTQYRTGFAHFALVAGFTEIGETLEETVAREVMEETGLRVRHIRYYKSQPWGIVDDLLAGFFCLAEGDPTIRMDPGELKLAEWRTPEEIELQPDDFSLTNEMMTLFKTRRLPAFYTGE